MELFKYRQWDSIHQRLVEGAEIVSDGHFRGFSLSNFNSNPPMQYFGMQDRKGGSICEGDIIKGEIQIDQEIYEFQGEVKYKAPSFYVEEADFPLDVYEWLEIVGNRYENPELLGYKETSNDS